MESSPANALVRVRYAPSPTGYLHVGGVRTLLFNYLYAKKQNGKLILRIEDTDQARSTPENERMLMEDINLLGLIADEGPKGGAKAEGACGPYRQSERMKIYSEHAHKLLDTDRAYFCFCPAEMIAAKREAALKMGKTPLYDGTCSHLPRAEAEARIKKGEKAGVRFRAPNKTFLLKDAVRGDVEFKTGTVGDFLITRSPRDEEMNQAGDRSHLEIGMPVYNFCCVIDDHLMGMTHIIRGEDHLANTARQLMIYDAFQWTLPIFAHTAMVLGSDRQKLSKRNGDTSARDYLNQGYLKEALLNFLAFLGWNPKTELKPKSGHVEILSPEELIQAFDLNGLHKAPAVFDLEKLKWMNAQYMRLLPAAQIAPRAKEFFDASEDPVVKNGVAGLSQEQFIAMIDILKMDHGLLTDLPAASAVFFTDQPQLNAPAKQAIQDLSGRPVMDALKSGLEASAEVITLEQFEALQKNIAATTGAKGKALFMPIRIAITGDLHGPEIKRMVPLLGKARVLKRIQHIMSQC